MKELPVKQRLFFIVMYIVTITSLILSMYIGGIKLDIGNYGAIIFFIALTFLTESFTIAVKNISFSTSFAITLACYILFGTFNCIIITVLGFLCRVIKVEEDIYMHVFNTPIYGTIFNCCALILPILAGNYFYNLFGGTLNIENVYNDILPIILFGLTYLVINVLIISILMSIMLGKKVIYCFLNNISPGILNSIVMIPIGIFVANVYHKYTYWGMVFIIFPIMLIRYTLVLYTNSKSQFIETVEALMNAIDARDQYTEGHSRRVAEISTIIAKELKYNQWEIEQLNVAAMLHDVGKIGISDNILNKPGKLTDDEFNKIKDHSTIGLKIIKEIKNINYVHQIVRNHHERYDGKGYPDGKKGDELPQNVYIVQLADTVDAMISDRPYRKGLPMNVVIEELEKYSGTQFHPRIAEVYLKILREQARNQSTNTHYEDKVVYGG
ncbi:MAG: HD-GYP domain-containing protein [Clostridium sp.]|uniref:HD-GYP domain-containing protein n=1 Tax=Clostridium sp. TaxID=1506 RepID=UPI0030438A08